MQTLNTSSLGQSFALTRCCHSQEKKPRQRRTKEERRMMVESFIKKYRSSNNGNFPSLNLTHKEVGGSFYTVREIVRDIIQENKVLGAGSLSLKSLKLEDCLENDKTKHLTVNSQNELSISSLAHAIDCEELKVSSISSDYESEKGCELENYGHHDMFGCHPVDVSIPQVLHSKPSDCQKQKTNIEGHDQNLVMVDLNESNITRAAAHADQSVTYGLSNQETHGVSDNCYIHNVEQPHPFGQSFSSNSPAKEVMLLNKDVKSNSSLAEATNSSISENNAPCKNSGKDNLPEDKFLSRSLTSNISDQSLDSSFQFNEQFPPLESFATNADNLRLGLLKKDDFTGSQELLEIQSSGNGVPAWSTPIEEDSIVNGTEPGCIISSHLVDKEVRNDTPLLSQSSIFHGGASRTEAVVKITNKKTEYTSSKSLGASLKEIAKVELKSEHRYIDDNTSIACGSSSKLTGEANEELEKGESNPVWNAIQALVTAFFKFFTE